MATTREFLFGEPSKLLLLHMTQDPRRSSAKKFGNSFTRNTCRVMNYAFSPLGGRKSRQLGF